MSKFTFQLLDTVQSTAIHIANGAFRTPPSLSLCAENALLTLSYKRLFLSANLLTSIAHNPSLPPFNRLFSDQVTEKNMKKPLRHLHLHLETSLKRTFKFTTLPSIYTDPPPWSLHIPSSIFELTDFPKVIFNAFFYHTHLKKYIDGSKRADRVSLAFSMDDCIF